MVDQGTVLVAALRRYLHGEITRDDLDRKATKDWLQKGAKLANALASSASGPPWAPDDPTTAHLAHSGQRAIGVVIRVERDGLGTSASRASRFPYPSSPPTAPRWSSPARSRSPW
jgi:hypothetical protein